MKSSFTLFIDGGNNDCGQALAKAGDEVSEPGAAPQAMPPRPHTDAEDGTVQLGLCRKHPFVQHLIAKQDPFRVYYALTFLAAELAHCQKLLVPGSLFYHFTKEKLAQDMRQALMHELLQPCASGRTECCTAETASGQPG